MSFVVRLRRAAEDDIARAQRWYDLQHSGLGADFHAEVERMLSQLAQTPFICAIAYRDVRRAVLRRFPYLIWYRVTGDIVRVLAVSSARQSPVTTLARFE